MVAHRCSNEYGERVVDRKACVCGFSEHAGGAAAAASLCVQCLNDLGWGAAAWGGAASADMAALSCWGVLESWPCRASAVLAVRNQGRGLV